MENNIKKDFVWNTAGSLMYALTSLIFMIIATRAVGADGAGVFTFAFTVASLLQAIGTYAGRVYQVTENNKNITDSDFFYNRIISCVVMMLVALVYIWIKDYSFNKVIIIIALTIFRCIDAFAEYLYAIIQRNNELYKTGKSLLYKAIIEDVFFLVIAYTTKNLFYACVSLVVINLLITILYDYRNAKKAGFKILPVNNKNVMDIFIHGFWIFMSVFLLQYIYNASKYAIDTYMVDSFQTMFGIIIMPATFIYLLSQFVVQPYLVPINEMLKNNKIKDLNKLVMKTTFILLACGFIAIVLADFAGIPVLNFIYKVDVAEYKFDLLIIIFSATLYSCSYIIINILIAMRKTFVQMLSYLIVSITSFVVSRVLVNYYGIRGASISYFISMALIALIYASFYYYFINKAKKNSR